MKNLLKYEIRKTWAIKLILLGVTVVLELVFLIGLWSDRVDWMGIGASLLAVTASTGVIVVGLASVMTLHRDMNTKQSYMLFMTPNSCYRILGAKMLENGVSVLLAGTFFFALGALDIGMVFAKEGQLSNIWKMLQQFIQSIDSRLTLNWQTLAVFTIAVLCTWICTVTTAYLGDVISSALLNGKRYSGLLSIALIILLTIGISMIQNEANRGIQTLSTSMWVQSGIALACAGIMYFLTAQIMERKLSV